MDLRTYFIALSRQRDVNTPDAIRATSQPVRVGQRTDVQSLQPSQRPTAPCRRRSHRPAANLTHGSAEATKRQTNRGPTSPRSKITTDRDETPVTNHVPPTIRNKSSTVATSRNTRYHRHEKPDHDNITNGSLTRKGSKKSRSRRALLAAPLLIAIIALALPLP